MIIDKLLGPDPHIIPYNIQLLKEAGSNINLVAHLKEIDDLEVLYTDFTEIVYRRGLAKAHLMLIIDHSSKLVAGHALGESADTDLALQA